MLLPGVSLCTRCVYGDFKTFWNCTFEFLPDLNCLFTICIFFLMKFFDSAELFNSNWLMLCLFRLTTGN